MSIENGSDSTSAPGINAGGSAPPSGDPPKRGPGRPRKDGSSGPRPAGETPVGADTAARKGRKAKVEMDRGAVARQIFGSHMLIGSMLGMPELYLSEKEADQMAEAVCDFSREYDFEPDPKIMAAVQLLATAGIIYVPRVMKVAARVKKTKAARGGQTIDGEATEVKSAGTSAN
ncbi:MAG: hypothetical protein ACRD22_00580 [Terriglobia bacterium]